jgi:deazaflavin-dependent oxidoreductase (nitroreductase family)
MLLTTPGRRSGRSRTTPVQFVLSGDDFVIVAVNGGAKHPPAWFFNLQAAPAVTAQIGADVTRFDAGVAAGPERERLWAQLLSANARLAKVQDRAGRQLPVVVLEPR